VRFQPEARVRLALPGGAGWGSPRERDPQAVLCDVAAGYVSIEAARLHYGVDVRFTGDPARILRRPEEYVMQTTDVVIFDIGGVLVQTHDLEPRRSWERLLGLPDWGLSDAVFGSDASRAAFVGQADAEDVWREVAARFGLDEVQRRQIEQDFWAGDAVNARWIADIAALQKQVPTAILSNAWRDMSLRDRRRIDMSGFTRVVYSWEERVRKPDHAVYERTLERLGIEDASQALFIDDFVENVEAARAVGLRAVRYLPGMSLEQAMATGV